MTQKFEFKELEIKGAYVIRPFCATDNRGVFIKDYNIDTFRTAGLKHELKETFYTISEKGVIRAIHFQAEKPQAKLMRCISGRVVYVLVDLRLGSETFGKHIKMELNGEDPISVFCPEGCGQGYLALEKTVMSYKANEVFWAQGDTGIYYNDVDLNIEWPFELIGGASSLIISEKDLKLMSFKEYINYEKKCNSVCL